MTRTGAGGTAVATAGAAVLPLALAQFIASYAGSNMNVAITTIADDLDTDVSGIQTTITLFTLTMAALMIPGSKLTDIWGRKVCFILGLVIYGVGRPDRLVRPGPRAADHRLLAARGRRVGPADPAHLHPHHGALHRHEGPRQVVRRRERGRGPRLRRRAADRRPDHQLHQLAGVVPAAGGWWSPGSRCSPGASTTRRGGRAPAVRRGGRRPLRGRPVPRRVRHPADRHLRVDERARSSDRRLLVCRGRHVAGVDSWRGSSSTRGSREQHGGTPLVSVTLFRNRTSNLGLVTQTVQWLVLQGSFFVISVFLQQERGYSAIQTGLMLVPATIGILLSSALAQRMATPAPPAAADPGRLHRRRSSGSSCCSCWPGRTPPSGPSGPACS